MGDVRDALRTGTPVGWTIRQTYDARWYLTNASPYMVYGEVPLPNGRTQRMSEVEIPMPPDR